MKESKHENKSYNKELKSIIIDTKSDYYFHLIDGSEFKNLLELADSLGSMSDDVFHYHVNQHKNDFSNWVREALGEHDLAGEISKKTNRQDTQITVMRSIINRLR